MYVREGAKRNAFSICYVVRRHRFRYLLVKLTPPNKVAYNTPTLCKKFHVSKSKTDRMASGGPAI